MKRSSAKAKGKALEDYVADQIVLKGIDPKARRDGASGAGNREKGDITTSLMVLGQNVGIECKNQATLCIPDWWRQTKKLESLGREPVLVFKIYGEPMEETKVVIRLDTFLEMAKSAQDKPQGIPETQDDRNLKWALEALKSAIQKVLRLL